jgi:hypothetical protein
MNNIQECLFFNLQQWNMNFQERTINYEYFFSKKY